MSHRLTVAGYDGRALFAPAAIEMLYRTSHGIPRLVNILAHKALMAAYGCGELKVAREHVRRAVADTEDARKCDISHAAAWPMRAWKWLAASFGTAQ